MTLPAGTVTFLFTDIEGSTILWETQPEAMSSALARHDEMMRKAIITHHGVVFKTVGDAFCAVFHTVSDAVHAAVRAQRRLVQELWEVQPGIRVRMAIHTGVAEQREGDYFGPSLNRVARLLSIGHGGQILLSQTAYELARDHTFDFTSMKSMGEHRLRDLARSEHVYQVLHPELQAEFPPLKSLDHPDFPNNLPQQVTSFIGREQEMATVRTLLKRTRLLTLTGSGGVGKTRLATQVAAELLDQFPQGVWFIELSSISDATLVLKDIATTLGIREEGNESLATTLTEALRHRKLLIIFDNCEHLIDACAKAAELLLRACPDVKILCTSREPLNISGEQTYRVPSLSLPNPKGNITPERLNQYEAVRLFIERAVQTRSDFVVTNQNAPALASLCARLDGIPLAIELAAARVRSLSVEEIEARLKDAFRLLTGGSRTALPRQQTLRAAIDWSYELLTPVEQTLLRRLAVFIGGWTLEAAEQVCSGAGDGVSIDDWEVLDLLSGLADRSLVAVEELKEGSRYRLLETVRQYSSEKLLASGEIGAISEAHLQWAVRFAEEASTHLAGAEQVLWMNRLETEHDNIRTALRLAFAAPYRVTEAMRLVGSLRRFWGIRGYWSEGLSHLATALALPGADTPNIARAEALNTAGVMAMLQGDFDQAYTYLWESEQLAKNLKEDTVRASSLLNLGNVARDRGQYEEAFSFYSEGIAVSQHLGNRAREANCRQMFGRALSDLGRFAEAQEQFEKALQVSRETGDRFSEAVVLDNLGALGVRQSHLPTARDYYNQALAVAQEIGYREEYLCWLSGMGAIADKEGDAEKACSYYLQALDEAKEIGSKQGIGFTLAMLAVVWVRQGKFAPAIRLYGFEETLRERIGYRIPPLEQKICEGAQQIAREQLGEKAYQSEYQTGATMNTDAVLHYTRNY